MTKTLYLKHFQFFNVLMFTEDTGFIMIGKDHLNIMEKREVQE